MVQKQTGVYIQGTFSQLFHNRKSLINSKYAANYRQWHVSLFILSILWSRKKSYIDLVLQMKEWPKNIKEWIVFAILETKTTVNYSKLKAIKKNLKSKFHSNVCITSNLER